MRTTKELIKELDISVACLLDDLGGIEELITHFHPEAEIDQTDDLIMKRYEDIKLQLVDLIMDIWDEKK